MKFADVATVTNPFPLSMSQRSTQATQSKDTRFAHLLQPIRDLADNWAIDIAAELEQYLGEVRCDYRCC